MKGKIVTILLAVIFIYGRLSATTETVKIEEYSYEDGLTTSGVNSVFKDSKGFLWLCSNNGLFRFDGYTFRNINTLVKDNLTVETFCITEDPAHNFLIGTVNGIVYYNTHTERLYPLRFDLNENFRINKILLFNKRIWAASNSGLLIVDSPETIHPESIFHARVLYPDSLHKRTPQDNVVNTLYHIAGASSLWVGTNGALYELDTKKLVFNHVNSFSQNSIRAISEYNRNLIVSSWDGGVFLVNCNRHMQESDPFFKDVNRIIGDKRVMSALMDYRNRLWVATFGNGLYIFDKSREGKLSYTNYRNTQTPGNNLQSDFINQMYLDDTGIVWLSMAQPALSKVYYQNSNLRYYSYLEQNNGVDAKEITAVSPSAHKSKLWIATNGGGIFLFDTGTKTFRRYTDKSVTGLRLQNNEVVHSYQDKKGNLWIVFRRIGLYVVPSNTAMALLEGSLKRTTSPVDANNLITKDSRLNSYITSFYEDSSGRLWVGGWGSLYIVEFNNNSSNHNAIDGLLNGSHVTCVYTNDESDEINFPISPVLTISQITNKRYWLGTFGAGIIQLEEISRNRFSGIQIPKEKIPANNVKCIYHDRKDNVWIGTNAGLFCWRSNSDSIKIITSKDGLSSENINNILEDGNSNIWVSTSYGISKINPPKPSVLNFFHPEKENYNQYISNAAANTPDGLIWFSTNEALVVVNPDSSGILGSNPALYFTDIRINNKTVIPFEKYNGTVVLKDNINESKMINVPYNHTLSIEFAALDFYNAGRLLYKYRIGNDNEWIILNSNQRSLSIPNLKHGEYVLNVMLSNSEDDNNMRSITINYLPPFWLSKIAYLIYITVFLILLLTYRKLLIQRIYQRSIIEKERFERKRLQELDKMKTEFFSNISHEFRTPLSLIINPLEKLVKEEDISDKNKGKINLILKSSNRLLKLTNELMDFSKIEKELLKPDFQLCEIVSFVHEICQLFSNFAYSMDLDFKTSYSFERWEIPIDKGMMEKVIFNLLSNAFKYTPANGMVMVNITRSHAHDGEYIKLSIINTGEGIDKEYLGKIFDRYYQVNNIQNRNVEGTGIGLALVKSFVDLHNGKIEVKSEPDLETCFDIYLPVVQNNFMSNTEFNTVTVNKKLKDIIVNQTDKSQISGPAFHYKLLIVEDEEDILNYMIDELSSDFIILSARNGEEGLRIANKTIPDLIITDVMMPVLSGFELCKKLKNQVITSHIPILILSAKAEIDHQIEGLEMGADVYMVKPFNMDYLKAQILRLINFKESIYSRYISDRALIPPGTLSTRLDEEFMQKVMNFIEENLPDSDLSVDQLANCVALSKVQTYRKIKAISGLSIVEFIRTIRLKKAAQMIMEGRLSFSEIAFETGFSSPSYFSKCFHDHFGRTPSEFVSESHSNSHSN